MAGGGLYVLFEPRTNMPSVGASGGIAGVLAFYAFEFPRERLAFLFRIVWVELPAWGAFAIWIVLQLLETTRELSGAGTVAALAHLGGALVGFLMWMGWGDSFKRGFDATAG